MRGNDSDPVYVGTEFVLNIFISFSENSLIDVDIIYTFILNRGNMSSGKQANITVNDNCRLIIIISLSMMTACITLSTDNEMGMASLTYSPIAMEFIKYVILLLLELPDPEVNISGPTTVTAGQLVLTCTVRVVEHLRSVPSVEWSGGSVGRGDGVIESNTNHNGVISKKTLTFNPFHTSHGTCMADIIH